MSDEFVKYLIERIYERAKEASEEFKKDKTDNFEAGRRLAYYEVMDIIKSECEINGFDLSELGIDEDLDKVL